MNSATSRSARGLSLKKPYLENRFQIRLSLATSLSHSESRPRDILVQIKMADFEEIGMEDPVEDDSFSFSSDEENADINTTTGSGTKNSTKSKNKRPEAAKYKVKFNPEWEKAYPVKRVAQDQHSFFCVPCNKKVRCDHQGIKDVKVHCEGDTHNAYVAQPKKSQNITQFFAGSSSLTSNDVIKAEVLVTNFLV